MAAKKLLSLLRRSNKPSGVQSYFAFRKFALIKLLINQRLDDISLFKVAIMHTICNRRKFLTVALLAALFHWFACFASPILRRCSQQRSGVKKARPFYNRNTAACV